MKLLKCLLFISLFSICAYAQKDTLARQYFIGCNISSIAYGTDIIGYSFSGNLLSKFFILSSSFDHFDKYYQQDLSKKDKVSAVNILGGGHINRKHFLAYAETGISYLFGKEYDFKDFRFLGPKNFQCVGLPVVVDFIYKPAKWIGIGTELKWSFNNSVPYNNLMIKVILGKIRG